MSADFEELPDMAGAPWSGLKRAAAAPSTPVQVPQGIAEAHARIPTFKGRSAAELVTERTKTHAQNWDDQAADRRAAEARMPAKPPGFDQLSPIAKRSWWLAAKKLGK